MAVTTQITPPRVPFLDARTGVVSREWYMFFLSLYTLTGGGASNMTLEDLQLSPAIMAYDAILADMAQEAALAPPSVQIEPDGAVWPLQSQIDAIQSELQSLALAPVAPAHLNRKAYGTFHDTTTQVAAAINTAYGVTLNATGLSNGVTIGSPTSRIYVDRSNVYNFQFSLQINKASASVGRVFIWARVNGSDVANSATEVTLSGSSAATVAAWNFVLDLRAGDYFELMWSTDNVDCKIVAVAASAPVPGIPSAILTVTDNISTGQS